MVDEQAAGDGRQVGARFAQQLRFRLGEQADEGVLGEIGGLLRAAQLLSQPGMQPAMVIEVKLGNGMGSGHGRLRMGNRTVGWLPGGWLAIENCSYFPMRHGLPSILENCPLFPGLARFRPRSGAG
ncbi:hypothetical protein SDC9_190296 [bioreactor metagenome]|uniref:Uncharacterized protein n=1 Tax=bioreactor metagenome TaxID=1076179 RepID=A0A645HX35_9ZZZZ